MAQKHISEVLRAAGADLFADNSSDAKWRAQRALAGRTHYATDDTLRHFKSRILSSSCLEQGAAFWLIESLSLDYSHSSRGFRFVCFDVFGTVLERVNLGHAFTSSEGARRGFWAWFESFDLRAHYVDVLQARADRLASEAKALRAAVRSIR
jgi:hypothetical protein